MLLHDHIETQIIVRKANITATGMFLFYLSRSPFTLHKTINFLYDVNFWIDWRGERDSDLKKVCRQVLKYCLLLISSASQSLRSNDHLSKAQDTPVCVKLGEKGILIKIYLASPKYLR